MPARGIKFAFADSCKLVFLSHLTTTVFIYLVSPFKEEV
jgi:hypothetical protein